MGVFYKIISYKYHILIRIDANYWALSKIEKNGWFKAIIWYFYIILTILKT
jgi:hypothetical protein